MNRTTLKLQTTCIHHPVTLTSVIRWSAGVVLLSSPLLSTFQAFRDRVVGVVVKERRIANREVKRAFFGSARREGRHCCFEHWPVRFDLHDCIKDQETFVNLGINPREVWTNETKFVQSSGL